MSDLLRFTVPGKPEYVGVVRLAISSAANTAGFDLEDIEDIKIAVSEVCSNVFCCCEKVVTYDVLCELDDEGIIISIDDGLDETQGCCEAMLRAYEEADKIRACVESLPDSVAPALDAEEPFDLYTSIVMLRALMDEVDIFADRNNKDTMLIRMIKHF